MRKTQSLPRLPSFEKLDSLPARAWPEDCTIKGRYVQYRHWRFTQRLVYRSVGGKWVAEWEYFRTPRNGALYASETAGLTRWQPKYVAHACGKVEHLPTRAFPAHYTHLCCPRALQVRMSELQVAWRYPRLARRFGRLVRDLRRALANSDARVVLTSPDALHSAHLTLAMPRKSADEARDLLAIASPKTARRDWYAFRARNGYRLSGLPRDGAYAVPEAVRLVLAYRMEHLSIPGPM